MYACMQCKNQAIAIYTTIISTCPKCTRKILMKIPKLFELLFFQVMSVLTSFVTQTTAGYATRLLPTTYEAA